MLVTAPFEEFFEYAPDAIVVTNSEGQIEHLNGRAEQLFGHQRSAFIGKPFSILVPERFRPLDLRELAVAETHAYDPERPARQLSGLRSDGGEFPIDVMLNSIETGE